MVISAKCNILRDSDDEIVLIDIYTTLPVQM